MKIQIANIAVECRTPSFHWCDDTFELFQNYPGQLQTHLDHWVLTDHDHLQEVKRQEPIFDSKGSWASFQLQDPHHFTIEQYNQSEGNQRQLQSFFEVNNQAKTVHLYRNPKKPWGYPIDELFFLNAFSKNQTVLVHGAAIEWQGTGFLFCGVSGAGKTTLAQILDQDSRFTVLCDERNALTFHENQLWLSSTPWYGTGYYCVAKTLPLRGIFLLDPRQEGLSLKRLNEIESLTELLKVTFLPQFNKEGMHKSVDLLSQIAQNQGISKLCYDKSKVDIPKFLEDSVFSQG